MLVGIRNTSLQDVILKMLSYSFHLLQSYNVLLNMDSSVWGHKYN